MAKILLYNCNPAKAAKLKMLCRNFFIDAQEVDKADFGKPIAVLLGEDAGNAEQSEKTADFDEEMLYFADINGGFLSILLDQLRRKKLNVALKAVKTETNVQFTSYELYRELSAEREAIQSGRTAHNPKQ